MSNYSSESLRIITLINEIRNIILNNQIGCTIVRLRKKSLKFPVYNHEVTEHLALLSRIPAVPHIFT